MNSLEFIENEIKFSKAAIIYLKKRFKEEKSSYILENIARLIKINQEQLQLFQQIKTELEAWEISITKQVDLYDIIHTANYEIYKLQNDDLLKQYILTKEEYETVKKALEE